MNKVRNVEINGVPSDLGANIRGANMGPAAIRIAGLVKKIESIGYKVSDRGDITVPVRDSLSEAIHQQKFLEPIIDICQELCDRTYSALKSDSIPLMIGGDHSVAVGSIAGVSKFYQEQQKDIGVIWVDAHADINTPDISPSGNIHGMPLATLLGDGHASLVNIGYPGAKVKPENVALIAIRNIDSIEKEMVKKSGVNYYTMRDIDEQGMSAVMKQAIEATTRNTAGVHLSFDIDGIDPVFAPGVSTAVPGGLSYREAHLLLEMLAETEKMTSLEFVELNPFTDQGPTSANLTVDLILSALGKSIV